MRHDIALQDYRDFGENLGRYRPGVTNIPVYKTDGTLSGNLDFLMPDFAAVVTLGMTTLVAPSYLASVKHNKAAAYSKVTFGNGARFADTYKVINRNEYADTDFHAPRLDKVVTDAAPVSYVDMSEFMANYKSRYQWFTRVGAGRQEQVNQDQTGRIHLAQAYQWKTGGTISAESLRSSSNQTYLQYLDLGPDDKYTTPLSIGAMGGDSGSPVFAWDNVAQKWVMVAAHGGSLGDPGVYNKRAYAIYFPDGFVSSTQAKNISPDITDSAQGGIISWSDTNITQNDKAWAWQGLAEKYKNQAPAVATMAELDATKDLRFNGAGGVIQLQDSVNMGAGKLQFSANYTLSSAENVNATWVGGGVEVDADKTVLWQVNGLAGDSLHKIGAGTLHVNATGNNPGVLNVGDGTVFLDQRADAEGKKQAFSTVTLVSGRPTVVLANAQQINTNNVRFGYRGGTLDLNGNNLTFKEIRHTDSGARLVNHNDSKAASMTLTGNITETVPILNWNTSGRGTVDDIYQYRNSKSGKMEYFRLKTPLFGYIPANQVSNSAWEYLGTDLDAIKKERLELLNNAVFRGFIGEIANDKNNGKLDVNININNESTKMTLAGGMNLNSNLNVMQGTTILSGQPVPHAAGVVIDDDWQTSFFKASQIKVNDNLTFQVGEYAEVNADVIAGKSSRLMFGYNNSQFAQDKIWRCYSVINSDRTNCSQPTRSEKELAALPYSKVTGDIFLGSKASLYLGKVVYQGSVTSADNTTMTLDPFASWMLTGNSNITTLNAFDGSRVSMLPAGSWKPKSLSVDTLNASSLTLGMGVNPITQENDKLTIKNSALGGNNVLDVSLMLEPSQTVNLMNDLVMVDAPGGTSHNYFTMPDVHLGFSVYSPNYEVKESEGRVQWVLQHNAEPVVPQPVIPEPVTPEPSEPVIPEPVTPEPSEPVIPEPVTPEPSEPVVPEPVTPEPSEPVIPEPVTPEPSEPVIPEPVTPEPSEPVVPEPVTPEPSEPVIPEPVEPEPSEPVIPEPVMPEPSEPVIPEPVTPEPSKPVVPASSEPAEEPAKPAEAAKPTENETGKPFSPDDWFTIVNNEPLLTHTRALMASRQYLFSEALSSMSDRTSLLRATPEKSGEWVTIEQDLGNWDAFKMTQRTLSVGWDTVNNGQIFGLSARYTQGKTKGIGQVSHRLVSTGADYSWSSPAGWFADVSGRYMYLSQDFSFDQNLNMKDASVHFSMLAGSVKAGYVFHPEPSVTLTPYIGVRAGVMPGYTIKGEDAQIALSSSTPYYAISGLEISKSGLWAARSDITLSAGIEYQYAPGRSGSELTLSDRHAARKYDAYSDNRSRVHAGIEGKLTQSLSVNAKVKSSFGGTFTSDYGGLVGISYHFR